MAGISDIRHLGVSIDRPGSEVYAFVSDPRTLPQWAAGLGTDVEHVGGVWLAESPMGRVEVEFVPANDFGVLDHRVTLPDGTVVLNRLRVLDDGDRCDVVFTLRRRPATSAADFEADAAAVAADLNRLRDALTRA